MLLRGAALGLSLLLASACGSETNAAASDVRGGVDDPSDVRAGGDAPDDGTPPLRDVAVDPSLEPAAEVGDAPDVAAAETTPDATGSDTTISDATGGDAVDVDPGSAPRVIGIGDLHADLDAARRAFRLAGVLDAGDQWIGGKAIVVQTGDLLDRWYQERELMDWLEDRRHDAVAAGGDLILLAGNHEDNNLEAYYPDVDPAACPAYDDLPDDASLAPEAVAAECRKRAAALLPGGSYAQKIARKRVAVIVGDSVFVHGGLAPENVASSASLDDMNARWRTFARGEAGAFVDQDIYDTLWDRRYSDDDVAPDCDALTTVLAALGVSRMIVGHTPWDDINAACDGRVWRIDTGMSAHYGGTIQVLEIAGAAVKPLSE